MRLYKVWLTLSSSRFVYVNVTWDYTKFDWLYRVSICFCKCYMRKYKVWLTLSSPRFVYVNVTWDYTKFDWLDQVLDLFM
jgi:hypothetical protein